MTSIFLFITGALWGASALFFKIGSAYSTGFVMAFIRLFIGGSLLVLMCKFQGKKLFVRQNFHLYIPLALINIAIPVSLFGVAIKNIDTGLSSILNGGWPIFTILLSAIILKERVSRSVILGIILGIAGISVIYMKSKLSIDTGQTNSICMMVFATFCYALGTIFMKQKCQNIDPMANAAATTIISAFILLPIFIYQVDYSVFLNMKFIFAMLAMGIFCTGVTYALFFYIVKIEGAKFASMAAFLIPIFGTIYGIIFMKESLGWNKIIGGILILFGMKLVMNFSFRKLLNRKYR